MFFNFRYKRQGAFRTDPADQLNNYKIMVVLCALRRMCHVCCMLMVYTVKKAYVTWRCSRWKKALFTV